MFVEMFKRLLWRTAANAKRRIQPYFRNAILKSKCQVLPHSCI